MTNTQFEKMMGELRAMRAVLERAGVEARDEVDPAPMALVDGGDAGPMPAPKPSQRGKARRR